MSSFSVAEPDITLHLDDEGVIRAAASSTAVSDEAVDTWVGRPWLETVASDGSDQVRRMLEDARNSGVSAFGMVMQRFPSGRELPFEYTTIRVAGSKGGLIVLGRNLQVVAELQLRLAAAQRAMEQEYWKSRDVETRYRLLFDASEEAVLVISGDDFHVIEANPAAIRAFGFSPGWKFTSGLDADETKAFEAMLRRARDHGRAPGLVVHPGTERVALAVRASVIAAEPGLRYLLHVAPAGVVPAPKPPVPTLASGSVENTIDTLIDRLPDGFVVVGGDGVIQRANRAFLNQLGIVSPAAAIGAPLGRWLSRPGADASIMLSLLQQHGLLASMQTTISGELGLETTVEISGVASSDEQPTCFALVSRDVGRRALDATEALAASSAELLASSARQVGTLSLLQIVKQTADAVETHVIGTALARVKGNRTAAAELLGLSRQSLHAKLNRHLAEHPADDQDTPMLQDRDGLNATTGTMSRKG